MNTLLRPHQISQYEDTKRSLNEKLSNKNVQDKRAVRAQLSRVEKEFELQNPVEFKGEEKDTAIKERDDLQEKITRGMPSQEEMRKCPAGAIGLHRNWEKKNKQDVLRWKNLQLRLNVGSDDPDIANLERYRPTKSSLNMDNTLISGTDYFLPTSEGQSVVFSDEDIKLLRDRAPDEVFGRLALLTLDQRTILRQQYIDTWEEDTEETEEISEIPIDSVWGGEPSEKLGDE